MQHLHRQCSKLNDTCTGNATTQGHLQQQHIQRFVLTRLQKAKKGVLAVYIRISRCKESVLTSLCVLLAAATAEAACCCRTSWRA